MGGISCVEVSYLLMLMGAIVCVCDLGWWWGPIKVVAVSLVAEEERLISRNYILFIAGTQIIDASRKGIYANTKPSTQVGMGRPKAA